MFKSIFIKQETLAPPPLKEGGLALVLYIESKVIFFCVTFTARSLHFSIKPLKTLREIVPKECVV